MGGSVLLRAREAVDRGEHGTAYDLLRETEDLDRDALALLAGVAYAVGDLDTTLDAWERVHAAALEEGDIMAAAAAASSVAMHFMMDTGMLALVRTWIKRAEMHLEGTEDTPVHAQLAVVRLYERLLYGDFPAARHWAVRAKELGATHGLPAPAAFGRVGEARCLILEGDVARGLDLLDEAAAFTLSGEVDPLTVGLIYCELICAWQALAHYDRADEFTEAMERWCGRHPALGSVHGRCRVHRAEILRLRGPCDEAEQEALRAYEELRPLLRRELGWPLTELGTIRLQKGDLAGAEEAFLAAHEVGWDPQPGLALLLLARGDVDGAFASIADALEHPPQVPSKELPPSTELREAPLRAAQVEIALAAEDLDVAQAAAHELERVASRFESKALRARAAAADGRVRLASGDASGAREELERAVALWTDISAPYEAARARLDLAEAIRAQGDDARADLEALSARTTFERLGVRAFGTMHLFRRTGDVWEITFGGTTVRVVDLKGLHHLSRLLAQPGREIHVLDLMETEHPGGRLREADAGPLLDTQARRAYERRLAEIDEDIAGAEAMGDTARAERAAADRAFIAKELSRSVGLGGRVRRAGSQAERARVTVTRAVRRALVRIHEHHPQLGAHLETSVRTGTYCSYAPADPVTWRT